VQGVTLRETPTPSRVNLSAHLAASVTPPMVVSAITHSTGKPLECLRFLDINWAAAWAICMVCPSKDSLIPFLRPSIIGRMPTLGSLPWEVFRVVFFGYLALFHLSNNYY